MMDLWLPRFIRQPLRLWRTTKPVPMARGWNLALLASMIKLNAVRYE